MRLHIAKENELLLPKLEAEFDIAEQAELAGASTTALMHGLSPGTSPPPVRIPIRTGHPFLVAVRNRV